MTGKLFQYRDLDLAIGFVNPHVLLERLLRQVSFIADRAAERPLSRVRPHVVDEVALGNKPLLTDGARVGPLSAVHPQNVPVPYVPQPELHPAVRAAERLLSRVDPQVFDEVALLGEAAIADGAAVRVLLGVQPHVLVVGVFVAVDFVADLARKRPLQRVGFQMAFEDLSRFERLEALFASV